jgi:hypothetical protein
MNIFYIHKNPKISAQAMTDKHVVKMILESAQMLSTAHRLLDGENAPKDVYKVAYSNHPSTAWVRQNTENYDWLFNHFLWLCDEYQKRYNRVHKTYTKLVLSLFHWPYNLKKGKFIQPPCCMPDEYKISKNDHVENYRTYYIKEKIKTEKDAERFYQKLKENE